MTQTTLTDREVLDRPALCVVCDQRKPAPGQRRCRQCIEQSFAACAEEFRDAVTQVQADAHVRR